MENTKEFEKDYTNKIKTKITKKSTTTPADINNIIILLNYCFLNKNDFFVDNFNKRSIKNLNYFYNILKTNILNANILDIFNNTKKEDILLLKFIISNFLNNYEKIRDNNEKLCDLISQSSLKRIISELNSQN